MVVVTDFRSRLRTGVELEVERLTQEMNDAVAAMDSFIDHESYVASDDERVTIVRFRDLECQRRWSEHPSHREAQRRGREEFYGTGTTSPFACSGQVTVSVPHGSS